MDDREPWRIATRSVSPCTPSKILFLGVTGFSNGEDLENILWINNLPTSGK
jgi:hypothetical protein